MSIQNQHNILHFIHFSYNIFTYLFIYLLTYLILGDNYGGCSNFGARLSLQPKHSRASLTSDEAPSEFRRKSAGSPNTSAANSQNLFNNNVEPYIYAFDECERHADGTVILR